VSTSGCRSRSSSASEHTIVIVTADYAEEFREHGSLQHGFALYQESVRIPLIVTGPGVPAGRVVTDNVSIVDVAPTALELLGVAPEPRFEGRSLRNVFTKPADSVDIVLEIEPISEGMDIRRQAAGLVYGDLEVLVRPPAQGNATEAYDLLDDPHEAHPNPSSIAPESAVLRALIDDSTRERLRALGYTN
jgi:choline-sulfatase